MSEEVRMYYRQEELARLSQWAVLDRCQVVSVLGLGGIGKSRSRARATASIEDGERAGSGFTGNG